MNQAVRIYEQDETFYVPQFLVKIGGRALPDHVVRDVLQLTYSDNIEEIDSFEISLNNWDAETLTPKYEPAAPGRRGGLFDPGGLFTPGSPTDRLKRVEVWMGYQGKDKLRRMLTGEVTTLEPNFPASGALTLSVRGLNALHRFRTEQHTFAWEGRTICQIAEDLGRRPVRRGEPGLGFPLVTSPRASERSETYVFMDNQYDVVFLMNQARRHDYELVLVEKDDDEHLFFGASNDKSEPRAPYLLEWGRSLVSFRPTLSTVRQVSEVVVHGWNRRTNRQIVGSATWEDLIPRGPERDRMRTLAQAFGSRQEIITNRPVHSQSQAESIAREVLGERLNEMVQASGSTVGLPDLRAGRQVQIVGLGPRFDGTYFVTKSTHTLGDDGYRTDFEARREDAPQGAGSAGGAS